jgi:DNA-binding NarL/FixJ family response regulator
MVKKLVKMLVADDAPFIREIVRHLVKQMPGIELVGEAGDGDEVIRVAAETRPDLILMDIIMPKKSGIEATREILRLRPEVKVIAFSTADQDTMVLHALDAGCCGFLVKPFKSEELIAAIEKSMK